MLKDQPLAVLARATWDVRLRHVFPLPLTAVLPAAECSTTAKPVIITRMVLFCLLGTQYCPETEVACLAAGNCFWLRGSEGFCHHVRTAHGMPCSTGLGMCCSTASAAASLLLASHSTAMRHAGPWCWNHVHATQ
jgi:hypothetical protein